MRYIQYYDTSIGRLGIVQAEDGGVSHILFDKINHGFDDCEVCETPAIAAAAAQLREYFDRKRRTFDFPMSLRGTDFQKSAWHALTEIPYGETRSYKQIAEIIGNPKAVRAVGLANNRNPLPIVIPCHRVVGSDGKLVGYAGGLDVKQYLIDLEERSD